MFDGDRLILKVDGGPLQSNHIASPQTIERGRNDGQFNRIVLHGFEQVAFFSSLV